MSATGIAREDVLACLDFRAFYSEHLPGFRPNGKTEVTTLCPFHADKNKPNLSINQETGLFHCFACGAEGSVFDFIMKRDGCEFPAALSYVGEWAGLRPQPTNGAKPAAYCPPPDHNAQIESWQSRLWDDAERLKFLTEKRGLSSQIILEARLGHDGERYTIPIFGADGRVLFVKRYLPGGSPKYLVPEGTSAQLYGAETLSRLEDGALVLVPEGELDALRCRTLGYSAVSGTAGAETWLELWSAPLVRFDVVVVYDADPAGGRGSDKVVASVRRADGFACPITWPPTVPAETDVTDYTVSQGHSPEDFAALVEAARVTGRLKSLDLGKIMAEPEEPIQYAIPGWLVRRDSVCLAGEPKSGKSWLALALALALARGEAWLGSLRVEGGPYRILYADEENNPRLIAYRLRKLAAGLDLTEENLKRLPLRYLTENALNLDVPERLALFLKDVRRFKPDYVVLDSLIRFHGQEENSNSGMAALFAKAVSPIKALGSGAILIHHLAKPGKDRSSDLAHRVRGAGDILAAVDQLWTLEQGAEGRMTLRHHLSRWSETAPAITVTIEDLEACGGVRLVASEADVESEETLITMLEEAAAEGVLRETLVAALHEEDPKNAGRSASRSLSRLHKKGSVRKRAEGKRVRYWLTEYAPKDAQ